MIKKFDNRIEVWQESQESLILTIDLNSLYIDTFDSETMLSKEDVKEIIPYLQEFVKPV